MKLMWADNVISFTDSMYDPVSAAYRSVPGGPVTLYGTAYMALARHYLGVDTVGEDTKRFIQGCQKPDTGEFIGPELNAKKLEHNGDHDLQHLILHLNCAVLPVCRQFNIEIKHPLYFAHKYADIEYLGKWLDQRDFTKAWLEGNNILFIGQLLVYLRDHEAYPGSQEALSYWFNWLDRGMDPETGLWGTNGLCTPYEAMYGGYHQLLVYYYENHDIPYKKALIDTTLGLQHADGGFNRWGGGGACEDVDAVDILVNLYKLIDYRRPRIRVALSRVKNNILKLMNQDGGFPYKRGAEQSHMNIPATRARPNVSTAFATWFRLHTLALIGQVLTDDPALKNINFRFSSELSMGWHRKWDVNEHQIGPGHKLKELPHRASYAARDSLILARKSLRRIQSSIFPEK